MTDTPRVAESLDDLRVGQVVVVRPRGSNWDMRESWTVQESTLAKGVDQWLTEYEVVILSDPPPEPVTVSREAFDRLAGALAQTNPKLSQPLWAAALALVDEVRGV